MCNFPVPLFGLPQPSIPGGLAGLPSVPTGAPDLGFDVSLAAFLFALALPSPPVGLPTLPSAPSLAPDVGIQVSLPAFTFALPIAFPAIPGALAQLPSLPTLECPF
jgi:hypothetical protein